MKYTVSKAIIAAIFAASLGVQAEAAKHSKSLVVVSPADLPEAAQRSSEAMYLHETGDGREFLYLEQDKGRTLAILDVTDLAAIRSVGQVQIDAKAPYDFVKTLDSAALVHYRDGSGFAVINFKKFKQPVLTAAPQLQHPANAEPLGSHALLVASSTHPMAQPEDPEYQVFDVSNPSNPAVLATIKGVHERLERAETGTLFLLGDAGLTVIRRPDVEAEYKIESTYVN